MSGEKKPSQGAEDRSSATIAHEPIPEDFASALAEAERKNAIDAEAEDILQHGDPFTYMMDAFNAVHVGDRALGECCLLSLASRLVDNSFGLHVMITGASGKGKSDACKTVLNQLPTDQRLGGRISDKSLYYFGNTGELKPRTAILVDDKDLSDVIIEILKETTSDFRSPATYYTVKDRQPAIYCIPERCVWFISQVGRPGDDQVQNRMLKPYVDDSAAQDRAVTEAWLDAEYDEDRTVGEPREIEVCRALWTRLNMGLTHVLPADRTDRTGLLDVSIARLPGRIRFANYKNRRNSKMFGDMVKAVARLNAAQREAVTLEDGTVRIYATKADFERAARIYRAIHEKDGGQGTDLIHREKAVVEAILAAGLREFDIETLQNLTGLPDYSVRRALKGEKSNETNFDGLIRKCPAFSEIDRSESISMRDDRDASKRRTVGRRRGMFRFNPDVYRAWAAAGSGGVWLDSSAGGGSSAADGFFAEQQHSAVSLQNTSAKNETADSAAISDNTLNTNNIYIIYDKNVFSTVKCESVKTPPGDDADDIISSLTFPPSVGNSTSLQFEPELSNEALNEPGCPTATSCRILQNTAKYCRECTAVNPADFSPLVTGSAQGPCDRCGAPTVHYKEKYYATRARDPVNRPTADDQASLTADDGDPPAPATPIRICESCYEAAREREAGALVAVPGAIPVEEVIRHPRPDTTGPCGLCGGPTVYRHPGSFTNLCERCYARLRRDQIEVR